MITTGIYETPTIEQIYRHASVRTYKTDPVPTAMVEAIVMAGQRASTSSNLQMTSVVAVTDADTREALARVHLEGRRNRQHDEHDNRQRQIHRRQQDKRRYQGEKCAPKAGETHDEQAPCGIEVAVHT